ncbi:MAG: tetratricopeptide repeat protein [Bacteroidota bacterium]|nr:tetratricopeptide repeat protein [Bacteroidota bacterium]
MKKVALAVLLVSMIAFTGCGPSRNKMISGMKEKEQALFSPTATSFDSTTARALVKMYEKFVAKFPNDSLTPSCLLKAGNLSVTLKDGNKAIEFLEQFIKKYPNHPKAEVCLFTEGFVYGDILKKLDKARETYQLFIEKYPHSPFVNDAQMSIQTLGKSPEQIVREIEARHAADSLRKVDSLAKLHHQGKVKKSKR